MVRDGSPVSLDREALRAKMRTQKIVFEVDLKTGTHDAIAWGCDLSKKYIDINAEYS
jgi:glutamate N-acetyltransferase/amino-acid N-acetyltransferase